jgi:DNA-binding MarR family transcriptional regulator
METEMPSDIVIRAWARLMRVQQIALSDVEAALKRQKLPPLAWYDALLELERAGEDGMRPFALQRELLLPQYSLSRLLERMERADYVERHTCDEDGRGQIVAITATGIAMRRRIWPVYARAIQDTIGARLNDREAKQLADLLGKLVEP